MAGFAQKEGFTPTPSLDHKYSVEVVDSTPEAATAIGVAVRRGGDLPPQTLVTWDELNAVGFEGKPGQTHVIPAKPVVVLVGVGDELDKAQVRDAAAAFANAVPAHGSLAVAVGEVAGVSTEDLGQAVVEGVLLSRYRYDALKTDAKTTPVSTLSLAIDDARSEALATGVARGVACAEATMLARDLANTPPSLLTAEDIAEVAVALGTERGFGVEVFDRAALEEMGCGGLLGVNAGSEKEPRMIKLTYEPEAEPTGRVTLVGKGIMYDAGGLAIKPGDAVHATMKNDMSGAGAILAAVAALPSLGSTTAVTGYLMCTDNVPSGSAMAMGDVLVVRGGKSVEVLNTDAEGRLVMADALVLATEEPTDAIIDIATLTGACLRTFGAEIAGLLGNDPEIVEQIERAAEATDEPVWELPLARRYRRELDSPVADIANMGGPNAGTITAALFLEEFVAGRPWAHIDIAGTAQNAADDKWRPAGCTGFGARLLIDFVTNFKPSTNGGTPS